MANNVNDLICVGAVPLALLDYVATDRIDEGVLEEIARGLYLGADLAGIAIPGGEIAQIGAMLADPAAAVPCSTWSARRSACSRPGASRWTVPQVRAGDVILGLPSSGLHSNGYSLARRVLFDVAGMTLADQVPGTARHLDDALLQPTRVYVRAAEALWEAGVTPRGLVHISGGGLLNLARLAADVSYELDALPPPPPIFAAHRRGGAGPGGHDVRDVQHGHRVLRDRLAGQAAGGDGRAEERRRGAGPGGLGHRPLRPERVDPVRGPARTRRQLPAGGRPPR